jgi:hypothetical protein
MRKPFPVDLDCHVFPLLDAIAWMGQASHKLSEIHALQDVAPEIKKWVGGIAGPDPTSAGELLGSLAWLAGDLLREHQQQEELKAMPGGEKT